MANNTEIEWTDRTWNFIRGCSRISRGCGDSTGGGCYAETIARRFSGPGLPYEGTISDRGKWNGNITFHEDKLLEALKWKKPQKVFVNSMSDMFHENVKDEWLDKAFAVMALTPHIDYQVLTKRPDRMLEYLSIPDHIANTAIALRKEHKITFPNPTIPTEPLGYGEPGAEWFPLKNVWLGVSVEDQKTADERIPLLLQTPAAVRFLSVEPLLGPVLFSSIPATTQRPTAFYDLTYFDGPGLFSPQGRRLADSKIDWFIVGTESGPNRRVAKLEWIESIVEQCTAAGVPVFVKQISINNKVSHDMSEWPERLRIREFPRT